MAVADTFGPFETCRRCGAYDFRDRHRCPPLWWGKVTGFHDDWEKVYGIDPNEAAEKLTELLDSDGETGIAHDNRTVVVEITADPDKDPPDVRSFNVTGSYVPTYAATEKR